MAYQGDQLWGKEKKNLKIKILCILHSIRVTIFMDGNINLVYIQNKQTVK